MILLRFIWKLLVHLQRWFLIVGGCIITILVFIEVMLRYVFESPLFGIEEMIVANGTDASETLAPVSIGGNQEPWEFKAKVGNRLALIGGVDQFSVLTDGTQQQIRDTVFELFEKVGQDGGYICSTADHFFETPPENLHAFVEAARECVY